MEVLGAGDVDEDVGESLDGIAVSTEHHVGETDIVIGGEVGGHDTGKDGLLVELDIVEGLEGKSEITQQAVDAQKTDYREVSEHAVEWAVTVLASNLSWIGSLLDGEQLLVHLRALDQRIKHLTPSASIHHLQSQNSIR